MAKDSFELLAQSSKDEGDVEKVENGRERKAHQEHLNKILYIKK